MLLRNRPSTCNGKLHRVRICEVSDEATRTSLLKKVANIKRPRLIELQIERDSIFHVTYVLSLPHFSAIVSSDENMVIEESLYTDQEVDIVRMMKRCS